MEKTRGNMIKLLTENITKMEGRIKALEDKDKTKDVVIMNLTERMNNLLNNQTPTDHIKEKENKIRNILPITGISPLDLQHMQI